MPEMTTEELISGKADIPSADEGILSTEDLMRGTATPKDLMPNPAPGSEQLGQEVRQRAIGATVTPALEFLERPARAIHTGMAEYEDFRQKGLKPHEAIMSAAESALAELKGKRIQTLTFGDLFARQMERQGAMPQAAQLIGEASNFVLNGVTDLSNLLGPAYRGVKTINPKYLDDVIDVVGKLKLRNPDLSSNGFIGPIPGRETAEETASKMYNFEYQMRPKPDVSIATRVVSAATGVRPEDTAAWAAHSKDMMEARPIQAIGDEVQSYIDDISKDINKLRDHEKEIGTLYAAAKKEAVKDLNQKAHVSHIAPNVFSAVEDLRSRVKALSSAGYEALGKSEATIPLGELEASVEKFAHDITNGTMLPNSEQAAAIQRLQSQLGVMSERYMDTGGEVPLKDMKNLLQNELRYDLFGEDEFFPGYIERAYKRSFHSSLNGKLKAAAGKDGEEYSLLMDEAKKIADFISDYKVQTKSYDNVTGVLSKYINLKNASGAYPIQEKEFLDKLINLSGRDDIRPLLNDLDAANSRLNNPVLLDAYLQTLPENQGAKLISDEARRAESVRDEFESITGGARGGNAFIKRISSTPFEKLTDKDKATIQRINDIATAKEGRPINLYQEILDRRVYDALSPNARADTQSARRAVAGFGMGAALSALGGTIDPTTAALMSGIGAGTGFLLDRYGPVVAKMYANTIANGANDLMTVGKTGIKIADLGLNLDKTLNNRFTFGFIDQLAKGIFDGHDSAITDPQTLTWLKSEIMRSNAMSNRNKAALVDDINHGYLNLNSSGTLNYTPKPMPEGDQPLNLDRINDILRQNQPKTSMERLPDEAFAGASGMEAPIPGMKGVKDIIDQILTQNVVEPMAEAGSPNIGAGLATIPSVMSHMLIPESYGEIAPGMAALPPWVKNKSGAISLKNAAKALGRDIKGKGDLGEAGELVSLNKNIPQKAPKKEIKAPNGNKFIDMSKQEFKDYLKEKGWIDEKSNVRGTMWGQKTTADKLDDMAYFEPKKGEFGISAKLGSLDPLAWTDATWGKAKRVLQDNADKPLTIYTRSDLIAHDDYIEALGDQHTVNLIIPSYGERLHDVLAPADPSVFRLMDAAKKLKESGIKTNIIINKIDGLAVDKEAIAEIKALGLPITYQNIAPTEKQLRIMKKVTGPEIWRESPSMKVIRKDDKE
jgi:hypothetical protein